MDIVTGIWLTWDRTGAKGRLGFVRSDERLWSVVDIAGNDKIKFLIRTERRKRTIMVCDYGNVGGKTGRRQREAPTLTPPD